LVRAEQADVMDFFCTVVKGGAAACTVIGGTGTGAQHGGAGREANLIFVLPSKVYVGPPGRGDFLVSNFHPGNPGGSPDRARKALNAETIAELHRAFRIGGRQAINKVMRNQPAVFLKLLVLLVPREMKVEHSNPIKDMTTEQIERSIEFIKEMIAKRDAAANAKVIEGEAEVVPSLPAPDVFADRPAKAAADNGEGVQEPRKRRPRPV